MIGEFEVSDGRRHRVGNREFIERYCLSPEVFLQHFHVTREAQKTSRGTAKVRKCRISPTDAKDHTTT